VPLIVITLLDQAAVTPDGKPEPVRLPMPVALVVVCVIFGVNAVLTVSVGVDEAALAVLSIQGVTVVVVVILGEGPTAFVAKTEKT
jgi:hypothetical protein